MEHSGGATTTRTSLKAPKNRSDLRMITNSFNSGCHSVSWR